MRLFGVDFFEQTSDRHVINLAGYHSPHSLTWRWSLSFSRPRNRDEGRWFGFWSRKHNCGGEVALQLARCQLRLNTQKPMWYRDLYMQLRDERDRLSWRPAELSEPIVRDHATLQ
jgi:hypothetical protein